MSYSEKNLLHAMTVLGYLPKIEGDLELNFGANFLHDFSIKMFLIPKCSFFPSEYIKQNVLLNSYLDN